MNQHSPSASDSGLNLDHLEAIARAATPGEWFTRPQGRVIGGPMRQYVNGSAQAQIASFCITLHEESADDEPERQQANAEFCAAANPAAVLELIALARRAAPVSAPVAGDAQSTELSRKLREIIARPELEEDSRLDVRASILAAAADEIEYYAALANQPAPTDDGLTEENRQLVARGMERWRKGIAGECRLPPAGWHCTRTPGHEGPCAAVPQLSEAAPLAWMLDFGDGERVVTADPKEMQAWITQHENPYTPIPMFAVAHQPAQEQASTAQIVKVLMYLSANGELDWRGSGDPEADAWDESEELAHTAHHVAKAMAAIRAQEQAEPVAWRFREYDDREKSHSRTWCITMDRGAMEIYKRYDAIVEPLYAASPVVRAESEESDVDKVDICNRVLEWNRASDDPSIKITREYEVAKKVIELYDAAIRAAQEGGEHG